MGAPSTPVFTTTYDIQKELNRAIGIADGQLVQPWQMSFDKTTQTVWFTTESASTVGQFDPATGQLRIIDLSTLTGVEKVEATLGINADATSKTIEVVTSSVIPKGATITVGQNGNAETFVTSKQSVKAGGVQQVELVAGTLQKIHNKGDRVVVRGAGDNPHGLFFDFNTHLTPRVWIADRNAGGAIAGPKAVVKDGRLSYLDLGADPNELVTYDFSQPAIKDVLNKNGIKSLVGFHAVFVDTKGDVWFSSPESGEPGTPGSIVQLNFSSGGVLNGNSAAAVVHQIPKSLGGNDFFAPHALQVVVDQRTGDQWVWAIDESSSGRIALLRPAKKTKLDSNVKASIKTIMVQEKIESGSQITIVGKAGTDVAVVKTSTGAGPYTLVLDHGLKFDHSKGDVAKVEDHWVTWDVDKGTTQSGTDLFSNASGTFVQIDDNETPGIPEDDKIVATYPVAGNRTGEGNTRGIIERYSLADPMNPLASAATIETWQIPKIPGANASITYAAVNQPFVDRSGEIFFIDRYGSVGRLNPSDFENKDAEFYSKVAGFYTTRVTPAIHIDPMAPIPLGQIVPTSTSSTKLVTVKKVLQPTVVSGPDKSSQAFLDLYEVADDPTDSKNVGRGTGAFRGFLNASNVLYSSLSQNDKLTVSVFAESSRRQMSAVLSPFPVPGALTQSRMAFQVLQDGSLVLTARGDGKIADEQVNLLAKMVSDSRIAKDDADKFKINGEANAVVMDDGNMNVVSNDDGTVYVMGRSTKPGMIVQYTFKLFWFSVKWSEG